VVFGLMCSSASLIACGDDDGSADEGQTSEDASVPSKAGRGGSSVERSGTGGAQDAGRSGAGGAGTGGAGARSAGTGGAGTGADIGMRVVAGDIAAVLNTVNTGEIELGKLALGHSSTTLARDYAQTMINEHSAAEERQSALFRSLNVAATDNALRGQLQQEARRTTMTLQGLAPGAFDQAYASSQVDMHGSVLRLIDETLLPSAEQAELRRELMLTRAEVQRHLTLAMTLIATLQFAADIDAGTDDAGVN